MRSIITTTVLLVSALASTSLALPTDFIINGNTGIINGDQPRPTEAASTTRYVNFGLTTVIGPGYTAINGKGGAGPLVPKLYTTQVNDGVTTIVGLGITRVLPTGTALVPKLLTTQVNDGVTTIVGLGITRVLPTRASRPTQTDTDVAPQSTSAPSSSNSTNAAGRGVYGASAVALVAGAIALGAALVAI
ncbi:unnamed protein product [Tilletia controversa]|uniref:Uncharacterized protein n=3 Tax=Tilletia TaxID=13289 RepID=A0A8X7SUY1_9BASI|nr:hypothetical protein CF336_g5886 [Tilletia laevis]KAE8191147.1 hypothetical protein CF328_g5770 [Tilletia controversa]KAE8256003.1 hypothetical protein A4X03_0g5477 [Tilletia caries]KAE8193170.1 hypothetical protein CF335_g5661 [Tilletia laevis]KAE8243449.1 hypothetical protein A4X06_0g6308 [Tilletia controversa]